MANAQEWWTSEIVSQSRRPALPAHSRANVDRDTGPGYDRDHETALLTPPRQTSQARPHVRLARSRLSTFRKKPRRLPGEKRPLAAPFLQCCAPLAARLRYTLLARRPAPPRTDTARRVSRPSADRDCRLLERLTCCMSPRRFHSPVRLPDVTHVTVICSKGGQCVHMPSLRFGSGVAIHG